MSWGRLFLYLNIILLVLVGILFLFRKPIELYWYSRQQVETEKFIYIPTGANLEKVALILAEENVISHVALFQALATQKNYQGKNVVAGKYKVEAYFTINHLINSLRAGKGALQVKLLLNNIYTLEGLIERISLHLEPNKEELSAYFLNPATAARYDFTLDNFLTMFIADTYYFQWNTSPQTFAERMYKEYENFWHQERIEKAEKIGLRKEEITILASIVKAEQEVHLDEQPIIAGLYINRLQKNMRLQADPTVKYVLQDPQVKRILNRHLQIEHPYNTYKNKGLPPGPINLPEKHVIDAVLNYSKHGYLYMCAAPGYSGKHLFSSSFSLHQKNAKQYSHWLNEQGIK